MSIIFCTYRHPPSQDYHDWYDELPVRVLKRFGVHRQVEDGRHGRGSEARRSGMEQSCEHYTLRLNQNDLLVQPLICRYTRLYQHIRRSFILVPPIHMKLKPVSSVQTGLAIIVPSF